MKKLINYTSSKINFHSSKDNIKKMKLGMVVHTYNPCSWEAEVGGI
jgi:hypothetical protein